MPALGKRAYVFVDESGDLGLKLNKGSTRYFVIVGVVFEHETDLTNCQESIASYYKLKNLPQKFEVKFHKTNDKTIDTFLSNLENINYKYITLILDKRHVIYKYSYVELLAILLKSLPCTYEKLNIVIDGHSSKKMLRLVKNTLRNTLEVKVYSVKFHKSETDSILQLADIIAGTEANALKNKGKKNIRRSIKYKLINSILIEK